MGEMDLRRYWFRRTDTLGFSPLAPFEGVAPGTVERLRRSTLRRALVRLRHLDIKPADVALASYPRSGNTWAKQMLGDLLAERELDRVEAERLIPSVGFHHRAPAVAAGGGRLVKTHEPYRGEFTRAIYLVRDVRDVALSLFAVEEARSRPRESFAAFTEDLAAGKTLGYGSWQTHVDSWLGAAGLDLLVLRYEDLLADPARGVARMASFLGLDPDPAEVQSVVRRHQAGVVRVAAHERELANPAFRGRRIAGAALERPPELRPALEALAAASPALRRFDY